MVRVAVSTRRIADYTTLCFPLDPVLNTHTVLTLLMCYTAALLFCANALILLQSFAIPAIGHRLARHIDSHGNQHRLENAHHEIDGAREDQGVAVQQFAS